MKKRLRAILTIFLFFLVMPSFSETVKIGWVGGMTSVPFVYMMDKTENFTFVKFNDIKSLVTTMTDGDIDAANIPINLALAILEKVPKSIQLVCITQNANYYIVYKKENENISSLSDLVGKEIIISQLGLSNSVIDYLFSKNNIPSGSGANAVKIRTVKNESLAVSELLNGKAEVALLTEPAVSTVLKTGMNYAIAIELRDEFEKINGKGKSIPITAMVARSQFVEQNSELMQILSKEMEDAISKVNSSVERTYRLAKSFNIGLDNSIAAKSIARSNYIFISSNKCPAPIRRYLEVKNTSSTTPLSVPPQDFFYDGKF